MQTVAPPAQTPAPAPQAKPPTPLRWAFGIARQVVITWVIYVLSIGPMYWRWYEGKHVSGPTLTAVFYEPLWRLCGVFPWLARFVNWYVSLWIL